MTNRINVVGLFCEDIREDKSGSLTLIGVMPDNANVLGVGISPKLCIFVRTNFDPSYSLPAGSIVMVLPSGEEIPIGTITEEVIREASKTALEQGSPIAGMLSRAELIGFRVEIGRHIIQVKYGEEKFVAATLNFIKIDAPSKPST
jgi:hypothetical protein